MFSGEVVDIFIGPIKGEPMQRVDEVNAVAGRGLEGDRYFLAEGTFSNKRDLRGRDVTLIESEAIAAAEAKYELELEPGETRRNIVTRGVPLNHLVGKEFNVGEVRFLGIKLAEPCKHLERLTEQGVLKPLIHRGGLRAEILTDGVLKPGDNVRPGT